MNRSNVAIVLLSLFSASASSAAPRPALPDVAPPVLRDAQVSNDGMRWAPQGAVLAGSMAHLRVSVLDPAVAMSRTSGLQTSTSPASPEAGAGTRALLRFDEGSGPAASDASGNGVTGTLQGGAAWGQGRFGQALSFNGSGAYVSLSNGGRINPSRFTVSAWVNPDHAGARGGLLSHYNGAYQGYHLDLTEGRPEVSVAAANPDEITMVQSPAAISPGSWHHVAATWDGRSLALYVDGERKGKASGRIVFDPGAPYVGWCNPGYFAGRIDEVRVLDRAQNALEILLQYRRGWGAQYSKDGGNTWIAVPDDQLTFNGASQGSPGPFTLTVSSLSLAASATDNRVMFFAEDAAGNLSTAAYAVPIGIDTVPPPAPVLLSTSGAAGGAVVLDWRAGAGEPAVSYLLYRSTGAPASTQGMSAVQTGLTGTSAADLPPQDGLYYYAVAAVDFQGNTSALSNAVLAAARRDR